MKFNIFNLFKPKTLSASTETTEYDVTRSRVYGTILDADDEYDAYTRIENMRQARRFSDSMPVCSRMLDLVQQYSCDIKIIPDSSDLEYNAAALEYWNAWCEKPDLVTKHSLKALQPLMQRSRLVDGDMFIIKTESRKSKKPRIQLIESHNVSTPPALAKEEGKTIFDGVQVDRDGRPKTYWVRTGKGDNDYAGIDEFEMIQLVDRKRINYKRGITHFLESLPYLHDLKQIIKNEVVSIKDTQSITKIIKTKLGELVTRNASSMANRIAGTTNTGPNPVSGKDRVATFHEQVPGSIVLGTDESMELNKPTRPANELQAFWAFLIENITAGFGLNSQMVFPERNTGATSRVILELSASFFDEQAEVLAEAIRELYLWIMAYAAEVDPDAPEILKKQPKDWRKTIILKTPAPGIDFSKNSNAVISELKMGLTTFASAMNKNDGGDFKTTVRAKAAEIKFFNEVAAEYGIDPSLLSDSIIKSK